MANPRIAFADLERGNMRRVAAFAFHDNSPEWRNMEAACRRLGMRTRADVPHSIRLYMFDKEHALTLAGWRSASFRPRNGSL